MPKMFQKRQLTSAQVACRLRAVFWNIVSEIVRDPHSGQSFCPFLDQAFFNRTYNTVPVLNYLGFKFVRRDRERRKEDLRRLQLLIRHATVKNTSYENEESEGSLA